MNLKIVKTNDGSDTIYNKEIDESYHSLHGSIKESEHVYINAGLDRVMNNKKNKSISILEIGLGTGLNVMLTINYAKQKSIKIFYHAIEPFPIENSILKKLNYSRKIKEFNNKIFEKIHNCESQNVIKLSNNFLFKRSINRLEKISLKKEKYDLIFFDAFAPSKQPDIWAEKNFSNIKYAMKSEGIIVTYSSTKRLKKILENLKFKIEILAGPIGKKEMTRAIK